MNASLGKLMEDMGMKFGCLENVAGNSKFVIEKVLFTTTMNAFILFKLFGIFSSMNDVYRLVYFNCFLL